MTTDTPEFTYQPMATYTYYDWHDLNASDFNSPDPAAIRFLGLMHELRRRGSDYILPNADNSAFVAHKGTNDRIEINTFSDHSLSLTPNRLSRHLLTYLDLLAGLRQQYCIRIVGDLSQPVFTDTLQVYCLTASNSFRSYSTNPAVWLPSSTQVVTTTLPTPDPETRPDKLYYYIRYAISTEDWPSYDASALIACSTPPPFFAHRPVDDFNAPAGFIGNNGPTRTPPKIQIFSIAPYEQYNFTYHAANDFARLRNLVSKMSRTIAAHEAINGDHLLMNNIVEKSASCEYPMALAHAIRNQCTPGTADMINQYGPDHGTRIYELLSNAGFPDLDDIQLNGSAYVCNDADCGDCGYCEAKERVDELENIIADARRELENA